MLLLQRVAFNFTRIVLTLDELLDGVGHVLEEADLLEEWTRHRVPEGLAADQWEDAIRVEEASFDQVLRQVREGSELRAQLLDAKTRPFVRREVRKFMGS